MLGLAICTGMKPLPPCPAAVNQSLVDDSWNRQNVRWTRATVWAALNAADAAKQMSNQPQGLQRCAACAAEISSATKPVCSRCKRVSIDTTGVVLTLELVSKLPVFQIYFCDRDCQRAAFPVHKHFCRTPETYQLTNSVQVTWSANFCIIGFQYSHYAYHYGGAVAQVHKPSSHMGRLHAAGLRTLLCQPWKASML